MTHSEYLSWVEFYKLHPFDDKHRYHRPAALIGASMAGEYQQKLEFLSPDPLPDGMTQADLSVFRAFGFKPR